MQQKLPLNMNLLSSATKIPAVMGSMMLIIGGCCIVVERFAYGAKIYTGLTTLIFCTRFWYSTGA